MLISYLPCFLVRFILFSDKMLYDISYVRVEFWINRSVVSHWFFYIWILIETSSFVLLSSLFTYVTPTFAFFVLHDGMFVIKALYVMADFNWFCVMSFCIGLIDFFLAVYMIKSVVCLSIMLFIEYNLLWSSGIFVVY